MFWGEANTKNSKSTMNYGKILWQYHTDLNIFNKVQGTQLHFQFSDKFAEYIWNLNPYNDLIRDSKNYMSLNNQYRLLCLWNHNNPANKYVLKVVNINSRNRSELCLNLT